MKQLLIGIFIGIIISILGIAILISVNPYISTIFLLKDKCNKMLRDTCSISNTQTELINSQNILIGKCYNVTLTNLTKLNCEKLL